MARTVMGKGREGKGGKGRRWEGAPASGRIKGADISSSSLPIIEVRY